MRKIKSLFLVVLLFAFVLMFVGCVDYQGGNGNNNGDVSVIDVLTLNDFHGGIEKSGDHLGLPYIANYVKKAREENENTILLAAGDMYQGGIISNYYNGRATVEIMNTMGFDAMVIGNHEFDWGIEEILKYHDGNEENGEANFPLLAANIVRKDNNEKLENTKDYIIVEKGDVKIGIIGTIGYGLESDILEENVKDYKFLVPQDVISNITYDLRKNQDVDVVIALTHDDGGYTNEALANLSRERKIDLVINGHYHRIAEGEIARTGMIPLPYIQAGSYGTCIGKVSLELDKSNSVEDFSVNHISSHVELNTPDQDALAVFNKYYAELEYLITEPIATLGANLYRSKVTEWIADIMLYKFDGDIAFQNTGGVKYGAFSSGVDRGDVINQSKLFEIMPHDNLIKTCEILGRDIENFIIATYESGCFSSNINYDGSDIYINGEKLDRSKVYKFVTNDYIFDKSDNPFSSQAVQTNTALLVRDLMIEEILLQKEANDGIFNIYNDILVR